MLKSFSFHDHTGNIYGAEAHLGALITIFLCKVHELSLLITDQITMHVDTTSYKGMSPANLFGQQKVICSSTGHFRGGML